MGTKQLSLIGAAFFYLFVIMIGLLGLAMTAGGALLASLGGSLYYVAAGIILVAATVGLMRRKRAGVWLFALALFITLVWSIWEVGFDAWSLMPRVVMLLVLGIVALLPFVQSRLVDKVALVERVKLAPALRVALCLVVSFGLGALVHAVAGPNMPPDPRFQTGMGAFPEATDYSQPDNNGEDWPYFGGDNGGSRFTSLDQITPENVAQLEPAWITNVGDTPGTNATPIKVGDTVYMCNNRNQVFAFDAATGRQRWTYDPHTVVISACRGVALYTTPGATGLCASRILTGTSTAKLIALDVTTGTPCPDFGENGIVDLTVGMGDAHGDIIGGYYRVTSAPTVVRGNVVVGGWVFDHQYWGEPSGVIRAFDAVTGELAWAWDAGQPDRTGAPPAGQNYTPNTPNSWAPMSADEELGMVFLPTGSSTPDFFGGQRRPVDDQFGSAVIALDAETGRLRWSFQAVHHDVWDYDVASQPSLIDIRDRSGVLRQALVQPTKRGEIYVLDRRTGEPIYEVTERAVPQNGAVPEERLSPTQPYSDAMPSFRNATVRENDMWGLTPIDQLLCRIQFRGLRYDGDFTPPGLTPSLNSPSAFGTINWGGVSVDPIHGVMFVNSSRMTGSTNLITREEATSRGMHRAGEWEGRPRGSPMENTPYAVGRPSGNLLAPSGIQNALGLLCLAPPYGYLSAVDLNTGRLIWTERFGTALGSGPLGFRFPFAVPMGTPTHGGSLVTKSGILFIGASKDNMFSAYDVRTGRLLWRYELPGGGGAPISFSLNGRQYIALSAGGQGAIQSRMSTQMIAFALPSQ